MAASATAAALATLAARAAALASAADSGIQIVVPLAVLAAAISTVFASGHLFYIRSKYFFLRIKELKS